MFFIGTDTSLGATFASSVLITVMIVICIITTLLVSKILSKTILRGLPSAFTLELPPYRAPQIGKVIVRSIFDRTIFVLGRALIFAIPSGIILWLMANLQINSSTLLSFCSNFLDPFAKFIGLDGTILLAFILALPANELVIPIIIMTYASKSSLTDFSTIYELKELFLSNGWTHITALCTMTFSLFHWPCSTTLLSIKKESGQIKWAILAAIIPTILGFSLCAAINLASQYL